MRTSVQISHDVDSHSHRSIRSSDEQEPKVTRRRLLHLLKQLLHISLYQLKLINKLRLRLACSPILPPLLPLPCPPGCCQNHLHFASRRNKLTSYLTPCSFPITVHKFADLHSCKHQTFSVSAPFLGQICSLLVKFTPFFII